MARKSARKRVKKEEVEAFGLQEAHKLNINKVNFTKRQREFLDIAFDKKTKIMFVTGPSGSSKSFLSVYAALCLYSENNDLDIHYVRTIAESGEKSLGHLPGEINEKFNPFMVPLEDKLHELLDSSDIKKLFNDNVISASPVNYLRGATWHNKIVIIDESQNFCLKELITAITRIGQGTKIFVCGDLMQSDINGKSGFADIVNIFDGIDSKRNGIESFAFKKEDIMRSEILKFIVEKLENYRRN